MNPDFKTFLRTHGVDEYEHTEVLKALSTEMAFAAAYPKSKVFEHDVIRWSRILDCVRHRMLEESGYPFEDTL